MEGVTYKILEIKIEIDKTRPSFLNERRILIYQNFTSLFQYIVRKLIVSTSRPHTFMYVFVGVLESYVVNINGIEKCIFFSEKFYFVNCPILLDKS